MSAHLSDQQAIFATAIREFSAREADGWRRAVASGDPSYDEQTHRKLASAGWLGVAIAEEYGGSGGSPTDMCVLLDNGMRYRVPLLNLASTLVVTHVVKEFGSIPQQCALLPQFADGGIAAIAMSEPGAGSDVSAIAARAVRDHDGFVLNGQKTWISNAHLACGILVIARTTGRPGEHQGLTMFWVPDGTAGVAVTELPTMAGREVNNVFFDDCRLPADAVVGTEDAAWHQVMACLNFERLVVSAVVLGIAGAAFDETIRYVTEREQFGQPIGRFQVLRHRIADHATALESARLLVYDVARILAAGDDASLPARASMAKLATSETAKRIAIDGLQMSGGYGYALENDMAHLLTLALGSTIYGGTSEIQREIISRSYGL